MKNEANLIKKETSPKEEMIMDLGLLSKKEVANMFRVECSTIDRWVRKGLLTPKKMGTFDQSRVYFDKNQVLELAQFKTAE